MTHILSPFLGVDCRLPEAFLPYPYPYLYSFSQADDESRARETYRRPDASRKEMGMTRSIQPSGIDLGSVISREVRGLRPSPRASRAARAGVGAKLWFTCMGPGDRHIPHRAHVPRFRHFAVSPRPPFTRISIFESPPRHPARYDTRTQLEQLRCVGIRHGRSG